MKTLILTFIISTLLLNCSNSNVSNEKSESIIGKWELIGYFKNNPNLIDSEGYDNKPITITFNENTFNGNTPNNSFFGDYTMNKDVLTLDQINITEITESDWGIRFTNSLNEAYNASLDDYIIKYSIKDGNLIIEYNSGDFMKFERR